MRTLADSATTQPRAAYRFRGRNSSRKVRERGPAATRVVATIARRIFFTMAVLLKTSKAFSLSIRCWDIFCEESERRFLNSSFLFRRGNRMCKPERDDAVLRARADHRDDLLPIPTQVHPSS